MPDTNINYNDLLKKLNVNLQLISEWSEKKNQLVLNKNKTFAINFSLAKTRLIT